MQFALLVCLLNCLYPINVKTVELIGHKFCVGPQKRFMEDQNLKVSPQQIRFYKNP